MTSPSKPLTPSPEMMERARKFYLIEHPDEDHTGCNGGKGCSLYVLALAFSEVAREAEIQGQRTVLTGVRDAVKKANDAGAGMNRFLSILNDLLDRLPPSRRMRAAIRSEPTE